MDLGICEPLANGFRFFVGSVRCVYETATIPDAADGLIQIAREKTSWLNDQMIDGRAFIGGDEISLADVLLYCFLNFGKAIGQPYDTSLTNIHKWFESINARESASA